MTEALNIASELWSELRRYVNTVDRSEAAEAVVSILVDNDCDAEDIRDAFKGDSDIRAALSQYTNDESEIVDEDEDFDSDSWDED